MSRKIILVSLSMCLGLLQYNKRNSKHRVQASTSTMKLIGYYKYGKYKQSLKTWNMTSCHDMIPRDSGKVLTRFSKSYDVHYLETEASSRKNRGFKRKHVLFWRQSVNSFIIWIWNFFTLSIHHNIFNVKFWHLSWFYYI